MGRKLIAVSSISPQYQTIIPRDVRRKLGIDGPGKLVWWEEEGKIVVEKA